MLFMLLIILMLLFILILIILMILFMLLMLLFLLILLLPPLQIKLVDPVDERGCEVEWGYTEDGERVRVSRRSGAILPIPDSSYSTQDYVAPESYTLGDKDTEAAEVVRVTYEPKLNTVEEEILKSLGIEETRTRGKTYWY